MKEWITVATPLLVSLLTAVVSFLAWRKKANEKEVKGMKTEADELREQVKDLKKEVLILEKRLDACEQARKDWLTEKMILLERIAKISMSE